MRKERVPSVEASGNRGERVRAAMNRLHLKKPDGDITYALLKTAIHPWTYVLMGIGAVIGTIINPGVGTILGAGAGLTLSGAVNIRNEITSPHTP